jgi:hypothetical protein
VWCVLFRSSPFSSILPTLAHLVKCVARHADAFCHAIFFFKHLSFFTSCLHVDATILWFVCKFIHCLQSFFSPCFHASSLCTLC